MNPNTKRYRSFEEYMQVVDQHMEREVGLSHSDIDDYNYKTAYEHNVSPVRAAKEALRAAGWEG